MKSPKPRHPLCPAPDMGHVQVVPGGTPPFCTRDGWGIIMKRIKLEEHNEATFQEAGFDKAILAIGSCESHGGHLPFGTDTFVPYEIALEVAQRLDKTVVLPPFGTE